MESVLNTHYWNITRVTGALLVSALLIPIIMVGIFAITGNFSQVFAQIKGVGRSSFVRNFSLIGWIIASLLSLAGFTLLSHILSQGSGSPITDLAWTAMIITTVFLILEATIHLSFGSWAAEEALRTGSEPVLYREIFSWASVTLQRVYVPVGYISLVLYGFAFLQSGLLPAWSGWFSILWGGGMLPLLLLSGVTLPATLLVPGLLIGIQLLSVK